MITPLSMCYRFCLLLGPIFILLIVFWGLGVLTVSINIIIILPVHIIVIAIKVSWPRRQLLTFLIIIKILGMIAIKVWWLLLLLGAEEALLDTLAIVMLFLKIMATMASIRWECARGRVVILIIRSKLITVPLGCFQTHKLLWWRLLPI